MEVFSDVQKNKRLPSQLECRKAHRFLHMDGSFDLCLLRSTASAILAPSILNNGYSIGTVALPIIRIP
jgi:hypothetical protein